MPSYKWVVEDMCSDCSGGCRPRLQLLVRSDELEAEAISSRASKATRTQRSRASNMVALSRDGRHSLSNDSSPAR